MEESIYNLIPKEEKPKQKTQRYVSKFNRTKQQGGASSSSASPSSAKKGSARQQQQKTQRKPAVPKATERPVMGLKSKKNFLKTNAVSAITAKPPKKKVTESDKDYTKKKNFGKTPSYLERRKVDEEQARAEYDAYVQSVQAQGQPYRVPDDERQELLDGLKGNWELLHKEYLGLSVTTDTPAKRSHKTDLEARLSQLEADIRKIEQHSVIYVTD
eukprot:m.355464 g.355464  ORF g.355464 m.355464 type:complete len:215 (-) comp17258_c0_seq1:351-995(-)